MNTEKIIRKIVCIVIAMSVFFSVGAFSGCAPETQEATLSGIAVQVEPLKTVYYAGEKFEKSGLRIVAFYSDKNAEFVRGWTYAPAGELTENDDTITISYTENGVTKTCRQAIQIMSEDGRVVGIDVVTPPTKLSYLEGENFSLAGVEIRELKKNGEHGKNVTEKITVTPSAPLTVDDKEVTFTYVYGGQTFTVKQAIIVEEASMFTLTLGSGLTFADGTKTAKLKELSDLPEIKFEDKTTDASKVYFVASNGSAWKNGEFKMPAENITLDYVSVVNPYIGTNGYAASVATQKGQYLIGDGGLTQQTSGIAFDSKGSVCAIDGKLAQRYDLPKVVDGYHFRLQTTPRRASNTEYTYDIEYTFYNLSDKEVTITVYQINSGNKTEGCVSDSVTLAAGETKTAKLNGVGFAGGNNFLTYFVFNGATADVLPIAVSTYITPVAVTAA